VARSVYVTAFEPQSGKSVVALGLVELFAARLERVGFFRPVVAADAEPDPQIELIRRRYGLTAAYADLRALTDRELRAALTDGSMGEVDRRALAAFRALEERFDAIVCEGADVPGSATGAGFDIDARLAAQLGCPVVAVVRGGPVDDTVDAVRLADQQLRDRGCEVFAVVVGRMPTAGVAELGARLAAEDLGVPVHVLAEDEDLARPTVGEIAAAVGASILAGASDDLDRRVRAVQIAAMGAERFVEELLDGALVVVPGDRADILVASLACALAPGSPAIAGLVLTGGEPGAGVTRLLQSAPFPVLAAPGSADAVAAGASAVRPQLAAGHERKVATALGLFAASVDPLELEARLSLARPPRMTPAMFDYDLIERAKQERQHIVLPEGDDDRVLRAADIALRRGVVELTILGDPAAVAGRASALGLELERARVVDPQRSPLRERFAQRYHELRSHRGVTEELAHDTAADVGYFGTLMVDAGLADGMVSGAAHTSADTIRPALEIIKAGRGIAVVSSVFFMCLPDRILVYGDCAVNPAPTVEQLAVIAISSAETASSFGIEPRVAMLSHSTGESGRGESVDAVREATRLVRERRPHLQVEGPIQYDAAVDPGVAALKLPDSEVAGRATVLIFPDLHTGNIAYKAVQRSTGAAAVGPVLQGLRRPINDLSRGCTVADIVSTVVITAIQAQEAGGRSTSRLRVALPTG